jgi:hypothetical protein
MAEWLNAPVLKTGILKGIWGSNPCFSATYIYWYDITIEPNDSDY